MRITYLAIVGALLTLFAVTSCGQPATTTPPSTRVVQSATVEPMEKSVTTAPTAKIEEKPSATPTKAVTVAPTAESPVWVADGTIKEDEYAHGITVGKVQVWWSNDAKSLYLALEAETTGWLAIGLDPENRMQGANYVIGLVEEGQAKAWDAYGTGPVGATHPPDTELGGSDDIVSFAAHEEDGTTFLEVQIPLDSGDKYDKPLQPGETYPVIVAVGRSDSFDAPHTFRAAGQITLDAAP